MQDSHAPVHALSQQTPLAQKPLAHALPDVHALPLGFFGSHAEVVVLQNAVDTQSASTAQLVLHVSVPQANKPQLLVGGAAAHAPALQYAGGCSVPAVHEPATHATELLGYEHAAEVPSQDPPHVPLPTQLPWPARGAPVTSLQVPTEPLSTHDSQAPPHARSQQTPSAHRPLAHCPPAVHPPPTATLFA